MSRKHYILIAKALGRALADGKLGYSALNILCELELRLKRAFAEDNPAFDSIRFGAAISGAITERLQEVEGEADSSVEAALRPEDHEHEEVV